MDAKAPDIRVRLMQFDQVGIPYEYRVLPAALAAPLRRLMVEQVRRWRGNETTRKVNHFLFDGLGALCRKIREGAASWQALDIIYNFADKGSVIDRFWIRHMLNAQAVRNRKRIIVEELRRLALEQIRNKGKVNILSLASGSAQAVFEALEGLPMSTVEVVLIDFDERAGPYALNEARRRGLERQVRFKQGNLLKFDSHEMIGDFKPDIIEMAGLLDYLRDTLAIRLMKRVREALPEGGHFITCHIHDNVERDFMTEVIEWGRNDGKQQPMLYRSRQELIELLRAAGFGVITLYVEPHHIHSVAISEKV